MKLLSFIIISQHIMVVVAEPITLAIAALTSIGIGYSSTVLYCRFKECCNVDWIKKDISSMKQELSTKVIGQHLVDVIVFKAIQKHIKDENPKKALVLSFHGWTGSGKNYVSELVAEHLYEKGVKSKYVHKIVAPHHYPHASKLQQYKDDLKNRIEKAIKACNRPLFIFDEMEKLPQGLIDVVKPYIDTYHELDGHDYRKAIFIFLSNSAGDKINDLAVTRFHSGAKRELITTKEMEKILANNAFNRKGGFRNANIILANLIDFFVPFLPMERRHVIMCIKAEMKRQNIPLSNKAVIDLVADELHYFPEGENIFSATGCKTVAKKLLLFT